MQLTKLAARDADDLDDREYDRGSDDDPWKGGNETEIEDAEDDAGAALEDDDDDESGNDSEDLTGGAGSESQQRKTMVGLTVPAKKV